MSLLTEKVRDIALAGKRRFVGDNVEISTDGSFARDGTTYLVEVDSGNLAKGLVGQYVLLNALHDQRKEPSFFLVVHTYKGYNVRRTLDNLAFVNQQLYSGNGVPFGMIHLDELQAWGGGNMNDLHAMIVVPDAILRPSGRRDEID
jgi:hypothetical protein